MPGRRSRYSRQQSDDDGLAHVWDCACVGREHAAALRGLGPGDGDRAAVHPARRPAGFGAFTMMLAVALAQGPRPAGEALTALDAALGDQPYAGSLVLRGLLLAMLDRIDEAWAVALPADERLREFGMDTSANSSARSRLVTGDYEAAAAYLREACDALEAIGNFGELSTYAPILGRVLCKLGRIRRGRAARPARPRARRSR